MNTECKQFIPLTIYQLWVMQELIVTSRYLLE